jgi:geranylgeranyl diphosphate synthase type I
MSAVEVAARPAGEILGWSRETVEPALRAAVDTLPASLRRIAGYHLGWWDERERPATADRGKALRPALVLLAADAAGGAPAVAVPAAVAVELVHNFSLLHDDVMDQDAERRHRPTAWTVFGTGPAILAGDALLTLALDVLAASGHPAGQQVMRVLSTAVLDLLNGQNADLDFEQRTDVDPPECLRMAREKTGALMACACGAGAAFGGGTAEQVGLLRAFGERLGLAFQHADDLLGIWGDPALTGKPAYSDLGNRKKSLPVVAALTSGTAAGRELSALYRREGALSGDDLARAAALVEAAGGRAWSQAEADALLARALDDLAAAAPAARAAAELGVLARLAARRDH